MKALLTGNFDNNLVENAIRPVALGEGGVVGRRVTLNKRNAEILL